MQQNIIMFLPFMMIAAVSIICLALLWTIGKQSRKFRAEYEALQDCVAVKLNEMETALKSIQQRPAQAAPSLVAADTAAAAATPEKSGVNSTNRSKVLKMHRLGQSPEQIAANLGIPRGEVNLLVKIHEVAMRSFIEPAMPA